MFVYPLSLLNRALVDRLVWRPTWRQFVVSPGVAPVTLPGIPLPVPEPFVLLTRRFVAVELAGRLLDNLWHTRFGLD